MPGRTAFRRRLLVGLLAWIAGALSIGVVSAIRDDGGGDAAAPPAPQQQAADRPTRLPLGADAAPEAGAATAPDAAAPSIRVVFAFARDDADGSAIWISGPDGTAAVQATDPGDASDRLPRWAPDGRALAFVRVSPDGTGELHVADASGDTLGAARALTTTRDANGGTGCRGQHMEPVWSPDGGRIAFTCAAATASRVLVVARTGGPEQAPVASEAHMADGRPTWSPDGRTLAFARRDTGQRFGGPERITIWTAAIDGTNARAHRKLIAGSNTANHPIWSPDGTRIAFVDRNDRTLETALASFNVASGTIERHWTSAGRTVQLYHLTWSPDSKRLAFPVGDGITTSTIHTLDIPTGAVAAITDPATPAYAPAWSPDGAVIAYDHVAGGGHAIALRNAAAGTVKTLAGVPAGFDAAWGTIR